MRAPESAAIFSMNPAAATSLPIILSAVANAAQLGQPSSRASSARFASKAESTSTLTGWARWRESVQSAARACSLRA